MKGLMVSMQRPPSFAVRPILAIASVLAVLACGPEAEAPPPAATAAPPPVATAQVVQAEATPAPTAAASPTAEATAAPTPTAVPTAAATAEPTPTQQPTPTAKANRGGHAHGHRHSRSHAEAGSDRRSDASSRGVCRGVPGCARDRGSIQLRLAARGRGAERRGEHSSEAAEHHHGVGGPRRDDAGNCSD